MDKLDGLGRRHNIPQAVGRNYDELVALRIERQRANLDLIGDAWPLKLVADRSRDCEVTVDAIPGMRARATERILWKSENRSEGKR